MLQGLKTAVKEFWMALRRIAPPLPPLGSNGAPRIEDLSYPR